MFRKFPSRHHVKTIFKIFNHGGSEETFTAKVFNESLKLQNSLNQNIRRRLLTFEMYKLSWNSTRFIAKNRTKSSSRPELFYEKAILKTGKYQRWRPFLIKNEKRRLYHIKNSFTYRLYIHVYSKLYTCQNYMYVRNMCMLEIYACQKYI